MILDQTATDEEIEKSLERSRFIRKGRLEPLIKLLNVVKGSGAIVSLNGEWGSGKTFLIRQAIAIWKNYDKNGDKTVISDVELKTIEKFYNNYIPFYYNAWENDYAPEPTQSILLSLQEDLKEKESLSRRGRDFIVDRMNFDKGIANLTKDFFGTSRSHELCGEVNRAKKIREKISKIITRDMQLGDRKLLFIIDDLDRCRPDYAVRLLESIKHHFSTDQIVFLVATNKHELAKIVSGYYGGGFSGAEYLDRIFDLTTEIGDFSTSVYLIDRLNAPEKSLSSLVWIPEAMNLTMREINRYINQVKLLSSYLLEDDFDICDTGEGISGTFLKEFLLPLMIAIKIKHPDRYHELVAGPNSEVMKESLRALPGVVIREGWSFIKNKDENRGEIELITEEYLKIFGGDAASFDLREAFWSAIELTAFDSE